MNLSKFAHRSKYGNKKSKDAKGNSFGSQLERAVYNFLFLLERAGEISDLKCQDRVKLTDAEIVYIPDFSYIDQKKNERIFVEAKGFETPEWKLKLRLWRIYGPGKLEIYKGSVNSFKLHEVIIPQALEVE